MKKEKKMDEGEFKQFNLTNFKKERERLYFKRWRINNKSYIEKYRATKKYRLSKKKSDKRYYQKNKYKWKERREKIMANPELHQNYLKRQKELRPRYKQKMKEYRQKNKEHIKQKTAEYVKKNIARVHYRRKSYYGRLDIKKRNNLSRKVRYDKDTNYKIECCLRTRISKAINRGDKSIATLILVGCSIEELKHHLEKNFKDGMSWDNYGYIGWHIDHIIPCNSFDLSKRLEQKKCFHYTNLQPLWKKENMEKSANYLIEH